MKRRVHQIQVSVEIEKPRNVRITKRFLNAALRYRAATGEDVPGVHVKTIIWWVNGKENLYEGDAEVTETLNALYRVGVQPAFRALGKGEGAEPSELDVD